MKIITLNTWGGRITKELIDFQDKHLEPTDVYPYPKGSTFGDDKTGIETVRGRHKS